MAAKKGTERPAVGRAREILRRAIPKAAEALVACLAAKDQGLRLRAAAAILNRAGLTEADRPSHYRAAELVGGESDDIPTPSKPSADPLDLPCPKCAGSVSPGTGATDGTCPHCATTLRLTLVEGETVKADS